ncbi:hypothetical protein [Rhodanobacter lindaniclasticus]
MIADEQGRRVMDAIGFDQGARQWLLPIWPDVQFLGAQLDTGSAAVACATAGRDFVAGGQALLWLAPNRWEVLQVDSFDAGGLALAAATVAVWPAGTRLYPLRLARTQTPAGETQWTDDASLYKVVMQIDEACDHTAVAPTASYRGVPVLEWRRDEGDDPAVSYDRSTQTIDGDTGAIAYVDLPAMPFRTQSNSWVLHGRDELDAFIGLQYWLRGRMGTLWVPSFTSDLVLAADVAAASTAVVVEWAGYTVFGRQQSNRRDIRIELADGSVFYRRIIASAEAGSTETLTIDSALGVAVLQNAVRVISFLTLCEQAADSVSIDHITDGDGAAVASTSWAGIRHDL